MKDHHYVFFHLTPPTPTPLLPYAHTHTITGHNSHTLQLAITYIPLFRYGLGSNIKVKLHVVYFVTVLTSQKMTDNIAQDSFRENGT